MAGVRPGLLLLALGAPAAASPASSADGVGAKPETAARPAPEEVRAIPPGGDAPVAAKRGAFAVGARFPYCQAQGTPGEFVASMVGTAKLVCGATPVQVVIAPILVAAATPIVPRGRTTLVHVTVASVAEIGEHLEVTAQGDATVGALRRTELGIDIPITVAPRAHSVMLTVAAGGQTLGSTPLEVVDAGTTAPIEQPALDWFALDIGGMVGVIALPSSGSGATRIGRPTNPADAIGGGPLFGPRVGFFPLRRVGLEGELAFGVGSHENGFDAAPLLLSRGQLVVRAYDRGRAGLRVVAGAGAITTLTDRGTSRSGTSGEVHGGVAVTFETRHDLWLRLQISDVVTTALDAGFAHAVEVELGIQTRVGRRDRW